MKNEELLRENLAKARLRDSMGDELDPRIHWALSGAELQPGWFVFNSLCRVEHEPGTDEDFVVCVEPDELVVDCLPCRRKLIRALTASNQAMQGM